MSLFRNRGNMWNAGVVEFAHNSRIVSAHGEAASLHVLLVGNYVHDRQESMRRFADLFARELPNHGVRVTSLAPFPFFGQIHPGAFGLGKWLGYLDKFVIFPFSLRRQITRHVGSCGSENTKVVVHVCDHSQAYYTSLLRSFPHLVTCHDLLAVRMAMGEFSTGGTSRMGKILQRMILSGLKRTARIVCISEATRRDVLRILERDTESVDVIHNGLNYDYRPMECSQARQRLARLLKASGCAESVVHESFILHVGGNHWYKNREGVLRIYAEYRKECGSQGAKVPILIMVGHPFTPEMRKFMQTQGLSESEVISVVDVTDNEDLRAMYSVAELLLFPSLEEGFGWPIIEAQACGCRVVTTAKNPMLEIGGGTAVYLAPASVESDASATVLRDAVKVLLGVLTEDATARAARIEQGLQNAARFSVEQMMSKYIQIYQKLAC